MVVGRVFLRQPVLVGEGDEFTTRLAHGQVQLLGVCLSLPGQVVEARPPAVHGLQQVEVTDVGDTRLARSANAGGKIARTLAQGVGDFFKETLKGRHCPHRNAGGVERFIQLQATVGAPFQDTSHGQAGVGTAVIGFTFELQVGHGQVDLHQVTVGAVGILDLLCLSVVAEVGGIVGPAHFTAALGPQRQAQENLAVFRTVVLDFQGWRRRQIGGNIEHRAIGHDAARLGDGDLAQAQVFGAQLQFAEAVEGRVEAAKALMQGRFTGPRSLLEMLRFDEQAFGPQNGVT
ncbi:hypothetical protein D3C80_1181010 [compost metagenome]